MCDLLDELERVGTGDFDDVPEWICELCRNARDELERLMMIEEAATGGNDELVS